MDTCQVPYQQPQVPLRCCRRGICSASPAKEKQIYKSLGKKKENFMFSSKSVVVESRVELIMQLGSEREKKRK